MEKKTKSYVTDQMVQTLLCPLSPFEVLQALKPLGSYVCSTKGLIQGVFLKYWEIIPDDLTSAF